MRKHLITIFNEFNRIYGRVFGGIGNLQPYTRVTRRLNIIKSIDSPYWLDFYADASLFYQCLNIILQGRR